MCHCGVEVDDLCYKNTHGNDKTYYITKIDLVSLQTIVLLVFFVLSGKKLSKNEPDAKLRFSLVCP